MSSIPLRRFKRQLLDTIYSTLGLASRPLWKSVHSVFVLSTGRTGTQTLQALLGLSDEIDAFHEPRPQLLLERRNARTEVYSNPDTYQRVFTKARGSALLNSKLRGKLYAETSARLTFFAPVIADLLPEAKFIYIHRDPASVIRSGMSRGWYDDHPADFVRIAPVDGEEYFSEWKEWNPFAKTCWSWDAYNRFSIRFRDQVDPASILTISAANIFDGTAIEEIFGFIGVVLPSIEGIRVVLERKMNAQTTSEYPPPDDWTTQQWETLQRIAGESMSRLGYISDNAE